MCVNICVLCSVPKAASNERHDRRKQVYATGQVIVILKVSEILHSDII